MLYIKQQLSRKTYYLCLTHEEKQIYGFWTLHIVYIQWLVLISLSFSQINYNYFFLMINYLTENSYSRIRVGISAKRYRIQSVRLLCGSGLELQNAVAAVQHVRLL